MPTRPPPMRPRSGWANPRTRLAAACALAALLSLLPWSVTRWAAAPANLVSMLVAPVQFALTKVLTPIAVNRRPTSFPGTAADVEHLRTRMLQLEAENASLRTQIKALQKGIAVAGGWELATPRAVASSLGLRGSLLQLRTDHIQPGPTGKSPIGPGSVAVLDGVNIVGRVTGAGGGNFATLIELVTDSREVRAVIRQVENGVESADSSADQRRVVLTPVAGRAGSGSGGRLTGSVFVTGKPTPLSPTQPRPVRVGDRLRLDDPTWPRFAQMLILGEVESVTTAQNDRQQVTVRPMYEVRELAGAEFTILILPPTDAPLPTPSAATPPANPAPKEPSR